MYEDLKLIHDDLDTSNYSCHWPEGDARCSLFSNKNKKVIGKFKDEIDGEIMTELVFLRSKAYAFKVMRKEVKRLKGITKSTINHDITFQDFKDAITEPYEKVFYRKMHILNSDKHEMYVKELNKKAISPYDDKRWISDDGIITFPHGYDDLLFT